MVRESVGKSPSLMGYSDDFNVGQFTLELEYDKKMVMEYNFFVTPQSIQISQPGRVGLYQSLGGKAHIDHMGQGLASFSIAGTTGVNPLLGPIGWLQFALLRQIIEQYYDYCRQGKTHLTRLILSIDFPDSPHFGKWDITIKELQLQRASQNPLLHTYNLSGIIVSDDLYKDLRSGKIKTWKDAQVKENSVSRTSVTSTRPGSSSNKAQQGLDGMIFRVPPSAAAVGNAAVRALTNLCKHPQKILTRIISPNYPTFDSLLTDVYRNKGVSLEIINYIVAASMITDKDKLQNGTVLYFPIFS